VRLESALSTASELPVNVELERTRLLIAEARAGRREAYDALFAKYRGDLSRALARRFPAELRRRVDVSDVIQETLVDAVRGFDGFEWRGAGSFRGWLARIAENRLRMTLAYHTRRARRDIGREGRDVSANASSLADATTPSAAAAAGEQDERIARALAGLAPDHAEVIRRVKQDGESLAQAAAAMKRSENAVRKLLARALLELGERLAERARP
jgi:RNA polymerase sigma-70 factor (ECF subfamily)